MAGWIYSIITRWDWREVGTSLLILLATWLAAHAYLFVVDKLFRRLASRTPTELDDRIWKVVRRPGYLLILVAGIYAAIHRYSFRMRDFFDGVLFILTVFIIIYTIIKIFGVTLEWYAAKAARAKEGESGALELVIVANNFFKILFVAIGLMIVLDKFQIDIKSILVTLGVGSLAIGLALQDTLANMFGGFAILLDRPFRVGDRIQLHSGEVGDVQAIGLRCTTILLPDHNLVLIPNAILVKNMVTNHCYPDSRSRVVIDVGISFGSDIAEAKRLMLEAANENPHILQSPAPSVQFKSFGEFALKLTLVSHVRSFRDTGIITDNLNTAIHAKFRMAGIEMPYPIQTIYLEKKAASSEVYKPGEM